jgi:predicted DsbA family dithiol-disulfide isomerase
VEPIRINHFSDILCVWAYVSQVRIDELCKSYGESIALDYRFLQIFGSAHSKIEGQWSDRGGARGYGEHVKGVVEQFGHVPVHPDIWRLHPPCSSIPGHLFLCAVRLLDEEEQGESGRLEQAIWAVRQAFFRDLVDVSQHRELLRIAEGLGLPIAKIEAVFESGAVHAALSGDLELARDYELRASPTLIFNEGRQRLTGNVGYRIIEANVRELLEHPAGEQSWC